MTREEWTRLVAANVPGVDEFEIPQIVARIMEEQDDNFIPNFWHAANTVRNRLDLCECLPCTTKRNWAHAPNKAREHINRYTFVTPGKLREIIASFRKSAAYAREVAAEQEHEILAQNWHKRAIETDEAADRFQAMLDEKDKS